MTWITTSTPRPDGQRRLQRRENPGPPQRADENALTVDEYYGFTTKPISNRRISVVIVAVVEVVVVVQFSVQAGGGGGSFAGLLTSPATTGAANTSTNNDRESNRLMESSVNERNQPSITRSDTTVSTQIGEAHKDYWAERARRGDLRAHLMLVASYEMTGELAEGLILVDELLKRDLDREFRSEVLLRKAVLQEDYPGLAWQTIKRATLDVAPALRSKLHNQRGRILSDLKKFDSAIIEYTATAYYAEMSGSPEMVGVAYNNLASIYRKKKRYPEAHDAVDKTIALWRAYDYLPHALDQKALVYLDEKKYKEAWNLMVVALSKTTDQQRWKAEFLGTLSNAQAGLGEFGQSLESIDRALEICDFLGDENLRLRVLAARKNSCDIMYQVSDQSLMRLALTLTEGNARQAAKKLGINHSVVNKAIKKHSLTAHK